MAPAEASSTTLCIEAEMRSTTMKPRFQASHRPQSTELVMDSSVTSHTIAHKAGMTPRSPQYPETDIEQGALQSMLSSIDTLSPTRMGPRRAELRAEGGIGA